MAVWNMYCLFPRVTLPYLLYELHLKIIIFILFIIARLGGSIPRLGGKERVNPGHFITPQSPSSLLRAAALAPLFGEKHTFAGSGSVARTGISSASSPQRYPFIVDFVCSSSKSALPRYHHCCRHLHLNHTTAAKKSQLRRCRRCNWDVRRRVSVLLAMRNSHGITSAPTINSWSFDDMLPDSSPIDNNLSYRTPPPPSTIHPPVIMGASWLSTLGPHIADPITVRLHWNCFF